MPNYTFVCDGCGETSVLNRPFSTGPVAEKCDCGGTKEHDFRTDVLSIEVDSSACRDHSDIPRAKRVYRNGTVDDANRLEAKYAKHVKEKRAQIADGGNQGSIKQSHAIPADLYHGKIRETGDKQYWQDKKNLSRHNDFKVG